MRARALLCLSAGSVQLISINIYLVVSVNSGWCGTQWATKWLYIFCAAFGLCVLWMLDVAKVRCSSAQESRQHCYLKEDWMKCLFSCDWVRFVQAILEVRPFTWADSYTTSSTISFEAPGQIVYPKWIFDWYELSESNCAHCQSKMFSQDTEKFPMPD